MRSEKFEFQGHSGETLAATLDLPEQAPLAYALFAHCFTCSKDISAARRISQRLAAQGIATLRFDFTGLGHSEGDFANTHFTSNIADLIAAERHMADLGMAPSLLIGHSLGGAAALVAAADMPSVKAVATIGAPADPAHVLDNFAGSLPEIAAKGEAEVSLQGRAFTIRRGFVDDICAARLMPAIRDLRRALLVLHAPRDAVVGIDNAAEIFMAAKHPKSFVTLDDADHLLRRAQDADYAADVIAAWAHRYMTFATPEPVAAAPDGVVRVSEVDPARFLQDISVGPAINLKADEPVSVGGGGLGASPYQLVSAGLGACTSMTIRMYARRKGWPLDHVAVDVLHDRIHLRDSETAAAGARKVDRFQRRITLRGDLDDAQRARLMEIADKCPVHRTLKSRIEIETVAA